MCANGAGRQSGMKMMAIESDEHCHELAQERIARETAQLTMF
jgi:hypothetical protein